MSTLANLSSRNRALIALVTVFVLIDLVNSYRDDGQSIEDA